MPNMPNKNQEKAQIWDIYIRIYHWLLAILVIVSYSSIQFFDNLDVHFMSGFGIIGLLTFRLIWGLFGSETAKFMNFIKGPVYIFKYIKSLTNPANHKEIYGHSPIGALSVVGMLVIILAQVTTGLFFYDEEIFLEGPLAQYGSEQIQSLAQYYHPIGANLVLALVTIHLIAIAVYYFFFKNNLILPMITGLKAIKSNWAQKVNHTTAIIGIVLAASLVASIVYFAG